MGAVRVGFVALGATLAIGVPSALPAPSRDAGVKVTVLGASQRSLLSTRAVRVRVVAKRALTVRLAAPGSPVRSVRFRHRATRTLSLRLGAGTRRSLARCVRRSLAVRARVGRRSVTARRLVSLDPARCRPAAGGGPRPGSATGAASGAPTGASASPSGGGNGPSGDGGTGGGGNGGTGNVGPVTVDGADNTNCDFLDPAVCMQPFPNDYFTVRDNTTPTGRRLNLPLLGMPANRLGVPVDPTDMNRADGFSPGSSIVTRVPGLDNLAAFGRTGAVGITDMARYADPGQPVVVIDAATGERFPVWSEIDSSVAPENANLIIRPSRNFLEGHRYIVALRDLRRADGSVIDAPFGFRVYRDVLGTDQAPVEERRPHMEDLFRRLAASGVARGSLYLAWDFTVASERSLTHRMLSIRDRAFASLGDSNLADLKADGQSPAFTVDKVTDDPDGPAGKIARRVEGKVTVPCFLNLPGCPPGATFLLDDNQEPVQVPGNTTDARFSCQIPRSALTAGNDARPSLYGHGLFGSRDEIGQAQLKNLGGDHNFVFCATDWIGMSCSDLPPTDVPPDPATVGEYMQKGYLPNCDLPVTLTVLQDLSGFPKLADRVQQGMLNFMFVGRAMLKGFNSNAAFQRGNGTGVIDTTRLFYDGNSQGGIIGGALAAVEPDLDRASIGVPGMNYSTLLSRSVDFHSYATGEFVDGVDTPLGLYDAYPNELQRPLVMALMQLLWDRAEADGYAQHMTTDPLPNTPAHHVLMSAALGDHQVANVAAETEARTIGAAVRTPYLDPGRSPYVTNAPFGMGPIGFFPYDGSAITMWDSGPIRDDGSGSVGTDVPPTTNTPPSAGNDPHELPRSTPEDRAMKSAFLSVGGRVIDTCGGQPCHSVTRR